MKIIQYIAYSYHIHNWWVEKISQTISDELNKDNSINILSISSDINKNWIQKEKKKYNDSLFIPSFEIVNNFPLPKIWRNVFRKHFIEIKKYKPNTIITHTRFFLQSFLWGIIAKRLWIKRIHIEHGSWFVDGYPLYIRLFAWLFDRTMWLWIFRQCDQLITISNTHKKFINKFTNKEAIVIYNPIDYIPQQKIKNKILHIWFVGRLVPLKWVDLLIHSLYNIKREKWQCTIVWDGTERARLEVMSRKLWLESRINFIWSDDRSNRLHKFDIFINPSYQEGVPTTVIEALMAKCIVVATNVWGTKEISQERDLILVKKWCSEQITIWIQQAIQNLDKAGQSENIVNKKFNTKTIIEKYKKIILQK